MHRCTPAFLGAFPRLPVPGRTVPPPSARLAPWTDRRRRVVALPCHFGCAAVFLGAFPRLPASGRTAAPPSARRAPCRPVGTGACPAARVKPRLREWERHSGVRFGCTHHACVVIACASIGRCAPVPALGRGPRQGPYRGRGARRSGVVRDEKPFTAADRADSSGAVAGGGSGVKRR